MKIEKDVHHNFSWHSDLPLEGRCWPAGRSLPTPGLDDSLRILVFYVNMCSAVKNMVYIELQKIIFGLMFVMLRHKTVVMLYVCFYSNYNTEFFKLF